MLLHLWLKIERSENTRIWHLRRSRWFDRHLPNIKVLTLCFPLHFLLKFVLLSMFFKLLFVKSLWEIDRFFSLRLIRGIDLSLLFLFLDRLSFNWLWLFNNLRFFFLNRYLWFLFDDCRLAFNLLSLYNSCGLTSKERTPITCCLLLWLLRSLLEEFSIVSLLIRGGYCLLLRKEFLLSHHDRLAFRLASFFTHFIINNNKFIINGLIITLLIIFHHHFYLSRVLFRVLSFRSLEYQQQYRLPQCSPATMPVPLH